MARYFSPIEPKSSKLNAMVTYGSKQSVILLIAVVALAIGLGAVILVFTNMHFSSIASHTQESRAQATAATAGEEVGGNELSHAVAVDAVSVVGNEVLVSFTGGPISSEPSFDVSIVDDAGNQVAYAYLHHLELDGAGYASASLRFSLSDEQIAAMSDIKVHARSINLPQDARDTKALVVQAKQNRV